MLSDYYFFLSTFIPSLCHYTQFLDQGGYWSSEALSLKAGTNGLVFDHFHEAVLSPTIDWWETPFFFFGQWPLFTDMTTLKDHIKCISPNVVLNSVLCGSWNFHYVWILTYVRAYAAAAVGSRLKFCSCSCLDYGHTLWIIAWILYFVVGLVRNHDSVARKSAYYLKKI